MKLSGCILLATIVGLGSANIHGADLSIRSDRFEVLLTPQATVAKVVFSPSVSGAKQIGETSSESRPLLTLEVQKTVFGMKDGKRRRLTLDSVVQTENTLLFSSRSEPAVRATFETANKRAYLTLSLVNVETGDGEHATRMELQGIPGLRYFPLNARTIGKRQRSIVFTGLLKRSSQTRLGAVAIWHPETETIDDEILYQVWVNEKLPHPAIDGEWTVPRAKQWVAAYREKFRNYSEIYITGESLDELKRCVDSAAKMRIANVYMHLMTWADRYWPEGQDIYQVNKKLFPNGQADFKELCDYAKSRGVGVGIRTLSNAISLRSEQFIGEKPDRRLAHFWRGTLVKQIGADANTIVIKSDKTLPTSFATDGFKEKVTESSIKFVLIDDEILQFSGYKEHDDGSVTLQVARDRGKKIVRGYGPTVATDHDAGASVKSLTGHFKDHVTPDHDSDLFDMVAQRYADFHNKMGIATSSFDGLYLYQFHTGYGASKFPGVVYSKLDHPTWPTTSNGPPRWGYFEHDFNSVRNALGLDKTSKIPQRMTLMMGLHQDHWPAPSPYGHTYGIVPNAVAGYLWCSIQDQSSTHEFTADSLENFGLRDHFATAIERWRTYGPQLPDSVKERIFNAYGRSSRYPLQVEHFRLEPTGGNLDVVPFRPMRRPVGDRGWGYIQEHGPVYTYQYMRPNTKGLLQLENPYHSQTPECIIRVMKDFRRDILTGYANGKHTGGERFHRLVEQTLGRSKVTADGKEVQKVTGNVDHRIMMPLNIAGSGGQSKLKPKLKVDPGQMELQIQSGGAQITYDNLSRNAKVFDLDDKRTNSVVRWSVDSSIRKAKGLGVVITGDASNALFVIRVRGKGSRDYVIPIDFKGKRYIEIADSQVSWSAENWPITSAWKRWHGDAINTVLAGFASVPPGTKASVLVEDIQLLPEKDSALANPTIHCGSGTISILGVIPSDRHIWYRGGDKAEIYDLNWNLLEQLPVTVVRAAVPSGRSDISITNSNKASDPWLECQFFVRDKSLHRFTAK